MASLVIGILPIQGRIVTVSDQILVNNLSVEAFFGSDVSMDDQCGVIGSLGDNSYTGNAFECWASIERFCRLGICLLSS